MLERFVSDYALAQPIAVRLTRDRNHCDFLRVHCWIRRGSTAIGKLVTRGRCGRTQSRREGLQRRTCIAEQLADLIGRLQDKTLSSSLAKDVFESIWSTDNSVDEIIERRGLRQLSDVDELRILVQRIIEEHPDQVEQVRGGETKVLGYLVGQVMKASQGKADPRRVNELLSVMLNI